MHFLAERLICLIVPIVMWRVLLAVTYVLMRTDVYSLFSPHFFGFDGLTLPFWFILTAQISPVNRQRATPQPKPTAPRACHSKSFHNSLRLFIFIFYLQYKTVVSGEAMLLGVRPEGETLGESAQQKGN